MALPDILLIVVIAGSLVLAGCGLGTWKREG